MDTFKLPIREINKKYTKSELVILAWDSKQKAYNMHQMYKSTSTGATSSDHTSSSYNGIVETDSAYEMPSRDINNGVPVPKAFINEEGEIDLRRATGPQAVAYLNGLGLNIVTRM